MKKLVLTLGVVIVVGIALGAGAGVVTAQEEGTQNATENETGTENERLSFGQQISIIVSNQQAEVQTTIENEAFDIAFNQSERNRSEVVNRRVERLHERIVEMRERRQEIREEFRNGSISRQQYVAKKTQIRVRMNRTNESIEGVVEKARGLERAGERGINVGNIRELMRNARNMTGRNVSEIARGIAGRGVFDLPNVEDGNESGIGGIGRERGRGHGRISGDDNGSRGFFDREGDNESESNPSTSIDIRIGGDNDTDNDSKSLGEWLRDEVRDRAREDDGLGDGNESESPEDENGESEDDNRSQGLGTGAGNGNPLR